MEGDPGKPVYTLIIINFNPLPPHGGRRELECEELCYRAFQSTPSAWRETQSWFASFPKTRYFNPLPPHGGRPIWDEEKKQWISISIHSLRMEGDWLTIVHIARGEHFNPLPPHGGRLLSVFPVHTPTNFNPLPPHGGRRS